MGVNLLTVCGGNASQFHCSVCFWFRLVVCGFIGYYLRIFGPWKWLSWLELQSWFKRLWIFSRSMMKHRAKGVRVSNLNFTSWVDFNWSHIWKALDLFVEKINRNFGHGDFSWPCFSLGHVHFKLASCFEQAVELESWKMLWLQLVLDCPASS